MFEKTLVGLGCHTITNAMLDKERCRQIAAN